LSHVQALSFASKAYRVGDREELLKLAKIVSPRVM
jgi:hypothetical protein